MHLFRSNSCYIRPVFIIGAVPFPSSADVPVHPSLHAHSTPSRRRDTSRNTFRSLSAVTSRALSTFLIATERKDNETATIT